MTAGAKYIGLELAVLAAAMAAIVGLAATPAGAHGFRVGFIAPISGPEARVGASARDGFMLAARERDGHPDEESDGHLGGLDVYLLIIDAGKEPESVRAKIRELVEGREIEFVTWIVPPGLAGLIRSQIGGGPPFFVDTKGISVSSAATMHGEPFAAAFAAKFGRAPDPASFRGYGAARLIDRAVRSVAGDFSRRKTVLRALKAAGPPGPDLKIR